MSTTRKRRKAAKKSPVFGKYKKAASAFMKMVTSGTKIVSMEFIKKYNVSSNFVRAMKHVGIIVKQGNGIYVAGGTPLTDASMVSVIKYLRKIQSGKPTSKRTKKVKPAAPRTPRRKHTVLPSGLSNAQITDMARKFIHMDDLATAKMLMDKIK